MLKLYARLGIVVLSFFWAGCSSCETDIELAVQIGYENKEAPSDHLDLAACTEFAWDRVHVFTPYMTVETMAKELGSEPSSCVKSIESTDAYVYLVFVNQGSVVRESMIPRKPVDLAQAYRAGGYPLSEALLPIANE